MQKKIFFPLVLVSLLLIGCGQPVTTNVTTNTASSNANSANSNTNASNTANSNANSTTTSIAAREPDKYQAKISIRFETIGDQRVSTLPPLVANIARDGANHRMEFTLPNNEKLVYLDAGDKHLLIAPDRKQYAELNKDAVGFEVRQLMTPAQIIDQVKNLKGVQQVGEEQFNNRTVIRYRYGAVTNTQTQAGQVNTESFVLVDKETGLPVRSETLSESQGGNVQGVKGLRIVTEMSDVKTEAPADLFAEPADYKKVQPEEVRSQVEMVFRAITLFVGQIIKSAQTAPTGSPTTSPATSPTSMPANK